MRLIDADALPIWSWPQTWEEGAGIRRCCEAVQNAPTIEVEPVQHGDGGHETWLEKFSREIAEKLLAAYPNGAELTAVRHGRWVKCRSAWGAGMFVCSVCNSVAQSSYSNYCCNCGARMDDETEGEQE